MKKERLKPGFIDHYRGLKRGLDRFERLDPVNRIFNSLLHEFLISKQKICFLPSKEYMSEQCIIFSKQAEYLASLKGASEDRLDFKIMDNSLDNMDFLPMLRKRESDGQDSKKLYLIVVGLVPLKGLTVVEQQTLAESFHTNINEDEGVIQLTLIDARVSSPINEDKQDSINCYLKRVAREKFQKFAEMRGSSTDFEYSFLQRIKDFWLDGGI